MSGNAATHLLPPQTIECTQETLIALIERLDLDKSLEMAVFKALEGKSRLLPDSTLTPCVAMVHLSSLSVDGREHPSSRYVAAAMEILMAAGDLIDDIQDDEVPLPHSREDVGEVLNLIAVLLMACHVAIREVANTGLSAERVLRCLDIIDRLGIRALNGQARDLLMEGQGNASIQASLESTRMKSASLTKCAAQLGAAVATDDETIIDLHGQFGWHIGISEQLLNDTKALWPGQNIKSDVRLRKKTPPVAYALSFDPADHPAIASVKNYYTSKVDTASEDRIRADLWHSGGLHYAWIMAAKHIASAKRIAGYFDGSRNDPWPLARLLT